MIRPNPMLAELEQMARNSRAGIKGVVTPEQMDSMEPDRAAHLVNYLLGQVNVDEMREQRRQAIRMLAIWCAGSALASGLLVFLLMLLVFSPFKRLAVGIERIADRQGQSQVIPVPWPIGGQPQQPNN